MKLSRHKLPKRVNPKPTRSSKHKGSAAWVEKKQAKLKKANAMDTDTAENVPIVLTEEQKEAAKLGEKESECSQECLQKEIF